jgi:hypothetical protein
VASYDMQGDAEDLFLPGSSRVKKERKKLLSTWNLISDSRESRSVGLYHWPIETDVTDGHIGKM